MSLRDLEVALTRAGRGWSFAGFCHSRLPTAVTGSVGLHRPLDRRRGAPTDIFPARVEAGDISL